MPQSPPPNVIWVPVQKPTFDLVGVVLSSFGIAGICAGVALALGVVLGIVLILRARRQDVPLGGRVTTLGLVQPS
jgi:hypothetical protein